MESKVFYESILSSPLFAGYEKISEQCPMTLSQLTTIDKLKVVIVFLLYKVDRRFIKRNPVFAEYLAKKRAEGKHYNVALSHAMKKLVRLIYALQKSGKTYLTAA